MRISRHLRRGCEPEINTQIEREEIFQHRGGGQKTGQSGEALGHASTCWRDGLLIRLQPQGEAAGKRRSHGRGFHRAC